MNRKKRNLIGNVMIWGGLAWFGILTYLMGFSPPYLNISSNLYSIINVVAIIFLLVGGLWGMKR